MESMNKYRTTSEELGLAQQVSQPRVLVVEDDITFGPIWSYILHKANKCAILDWSMSVFDADEKIMSMKKEGKSYDLVISDIFLSGPRTGIDLWQRYRQQFHDNIMLVSAIEEAKMNKYFQGYQTPTYLQKPLDVPLAIQIVSNLLRRHS